MLVCVRGLGMAVMLSAVMASGVLPGGAHAAAASATVKPSRTDLCGKSFSGSISYDHGRYHWNCSMKQTIRAGKTDSFSQSCNPGKFDTRKRYGYWVSSPTVKLTKLEWFSKTGTMVAIFLNRSSKQQTFDDWESCRGSM